MKTKSYVPRTEPIDAKIVAREMKCSETGAPMTEYSAIIGGVCHGRRLCREGAMHIIREWIKLDNQARRKARND